METIVGIDLGTTNSEIAVIVDDQVKVIGQDGDRMLPSVIGLDTAGNLLVGESARNQAALATGRTVRSVKRQMGEEVRLPLGDESFTPQELSAMILRRLVEQAEGELETSISKAVITVPAYFDDNQRAATKEAGELAGLEVVRILNEPTAAALAYSSRKEDKECVLVYDLGGGTFDVSVVMIEQGVVEVLASHGDTHLGGDDMDQLLLDYVCDSFQREHGIDLRENAVSHARMRNAVEDAKKQLSNEPFAQIQEEFIAKSGDVPLHVDVELSRYEFEQLITELVQQTLTCVKQALTDARIVAARIDKVVLVGGATRTPLVARMLEEQLGQRVHSEVEPDLCVAMGAAIQAGLIAGVDIGPVLVDITPHTLGIAVLGELHGDLSPFRFSRIIRRMTALPASRSEVYATSMDGQDLVRICVYQGDDDDIRKNTLIGEMQVDGLMDVEAGNEVTVQFDLDLNGMLHVRAVERVTGLTREIEMDSVASRFKEEEQAAATRRLSTVFGQVLASSEWATESSTDVATETEDAVPQKIQGAISKANRLLDRAETAKGFVPQDDADELAEMSRAIKIAIVDQDQGKLGKLVPELEDLLFYLDVE